MQNQNFTHNLFAIQKKGWINRGGENQRQKNLFGIRPEVQNAEHSTESRAFVQFGQFSHSPFVSSFFFFFFYFPNIQIDSQFSVNVLRHQKVSATAIVISTLEFDRSCKASKERRKKKVEEEEEKKRKSESKVLHRLFLASILVDFCNM